MSTFPIPSLEEFSNVMTDLLGKEVTLHPGKPQTLKPAAPLVFSIFRDEEENPAIAMICDLAMAAGTGAALAMVSPEEGKKALVKSQIPESLFENFQEVVNIVGITQFNCPDTPHLMLKEVLVSPSRLPSDLKSLLKGPGDWMFADVSIEEYGNGKMTLLAAAL